MLKSTLRIVLTIVCGVTLVIGATLCGVGIWILANKNKVRSLFNLIDTGDMPMLDKYKADLEELVEKYDVISKVGLAFLMVGLQVIIVSSFGLYGSISSSKMFLIVARISAELSNRLAHLQEKYLISLISMVRNRDTIKAMVKLGLNFMHISLKCCGVKTIGDARNSTSWQSSERRIMQLMQEGVLFNKPEQADASSDDYNIYDYCGGDLPDWMKFEVPAKFTLPPNYLVPTELPDGFEVDEDFFTELAEAAVSVVTYVVDAIAEVMDKELTLRTPVTCCKLDGIMKLLQSEFDVQRMYASLQEMECVFQRENFGVNGITCYDAMWKYLMQYTVPVIVLGSLLIISMIITIGTTIGIIVLMD